MFTNSIHCSDLFVTTCIKMEWIEDNVIDIVQTIYMASYSTLQAFPKRMAIFVHVMNPSSILLSDHVRLTYKVYTYPLYVHNVIL